MSFQILITLTTAGSNTGPFDIFQNSDGYAIPIVTGVTKSTLLSGYTVTVSNTTTAVAVVSQGTCSSNPLIMNISGIPQTYNRALPPSGSFAGSNIITCGAITPIVNIYLNALDYSTYISNGYLLQEGMTLYSNGSGAIYTYTRIYDPTATNIYNVSSGVVGTPIPGGFC
jgi:hypothetical protein